MLKMLVVALGLLGGPDAFQVNDNLTDAAAGTLVNSLLNSSTGIFVYTGNVDIVREPLEAKRFQVPARQFEDTYVLLRSMGLLTLDAVDAGTDPAGDGLPQAVTVGLTTLGHEFSVSRAPNVSLISLGKYRVRHVTDNREIRNGSTLLRVVRFLFDAEWRPFVTPDLMEPCAEDLSNARKGSALLGYDRAGERWQLLTADFANEAGEFCTSNVDEVLSRFSRESGDLLR